MLKCFVNNAYGRLWEPSYMVRELKTVGERIREQRIAKGLDQGAVAKAAQITVSALSQIETNVTKQPKPETLFKIADALGVEARYLVFGHTNRVAATILALALSDTARIRLNRKP
jgi:transcriptional regulator with XRE-family HTH domain